MTETRTRYLVEIAELPPGLVKEVLRILKERIGRDNALARGSLLALVCSMPGCSRTSDRQLRACINQLRKEGHPICSAGGSDGGYWLAKDWEELTEYIERELHPRAMDMLEQEQALKREAEKRWGQYSKQFGLGI